VTTGAARTATSGLSLGRFTDHVAAAESAEERAGRVQRLLERAAGGGCLDSPLPPQRRPARKLVGASRSPRPTKCAGGLQP